MVLIVMEHIVSPKNCWEAARDWTAMVGTANPVWTLVTLLRLAALQFICLVVLDGERAPPIKVPVATSNAFRSRAKLLPGLTTFLEPQLSKKPPRLDSLMDILTPRTVKEPLVLSKEEPIAAAALIAYAPWMPPV